MPKSNFTIDKIDQILKETIESINKGKEEIFEIAENARKECDMIRNELEDVKEKTKDIIKEVDKLELEERKSRKRLLIVSRDFKKYSEEDIKKAYEEANNLQIQLIFKRHQEKEMAKKRRELEIRLKNAKDVVERAERLVTQVGVAMDYLSGNLEDILVTIEDMQKKQLLGIKILQAQEEERQRVARDIHDGPAQSMANVVLKAEICEKLLALDEEKAKIELKNLKDIVRNSLRDVRKIIYDLRPMSLDDLGLIPTIERYAYNFTKETGINVDVILYGKYEKQESIVEIGIFRIIQEALNNIKKHSKANSAIIKIEKSNDEIIIIVKDNGIGFNVDKELEQHNNSGEKFGILGMKERAELMNGELKINSFLGKGTKIIIKIPLYRKDDIND
ncbi:sensor histidine kinase [Thermohalobacter berrensis]|uniref:Oxygen sensor histidine kinase NreB n=1 Tax=Thermohalobacter berrensis TaxID=99594 RepID=A0A419T6P5_9FIRM|nr:sensor histidine kinase [Thermohalobacter berrensis]RKD33151.1 histidine kinase [Thermohalobacter berrensis]